MSLAQIRYFVAVAEEGTVSGAAARLRIAQPAVSRQIRALEDELGATLFHRTPAGMRLSTEGHVFLEHGLEILARVDGAARAVRSAAEPTGRAPRSTGR